MSYRRPRPQPQPISLLSLVAVFYWAIPAAQAQSLPEASRLGAFSGAMQYCADNYSGDRDFKRARGRAAAEVAGMSKEERRKAVAARDRARDNGKFLGKRLDEDRCRELLRASEWKRYR